MTASASASQEASTSTPPRSGLGRVPTLALCLALAGAASMVYYHVGVFLPRARAVRAANHLGGPISFGNDLYQIWIASRECIAGCRDPYSPEITAKIQTALYGRPLDSRLPNDRQDLRIFPYPAFAELFLWPLGLWPFALVRIVVACALVPMTMATVQIWMRALEWELSWRWLGVLMLLVLCSYPILEGLYAVQVGLLVSFLLAASALALRRGKLLISGALLALASIKPQVTVLPILYLLIWSSYDWRARGRFCAGVLVTGILLVAGATVIWPQWVSSWISVAIQYRAYTGPQLLREVLTTLFGSRAAGPVTLAATAALMVIALTLAWRNRAETAESIRFWLAFSIILAIAVIALLPGQAVYDHGILLPGIFLLVLIRHRLSQRSIPRLVMGTGIAVMLWPWMSALLLIFIRPLLTHSQFYSKAIFALPLRTAAMFPFIVLALLVLARDASLEDDRVQLLMSR